MKLAICTLLFSTACAVELDLDEDLEEPTEAEVVDTSIVERRTTPGENGDYCIASPYNCRFREGSSRVTTAGGEETWGIEPGASVRDGNGRAMYAPETKTRMTFNYGQTRHLAGKTHALALSTSNGSSGWYPLDHILGETSFRERMGEVNAKDPSDGKMACYQIRNSHDESIELKKVVYDTRVGDDGHQRAGDYLPLMRTSGQRSANLIFSVPGFALGGATSDHFRAGTKFQRVSVPTTSGRPSITIPLWVKDGEGRYRKRSGSMRFLYGYVRADDGAKRFGWMAQEAVTPSSGCR